MRSRNQASNLFRRLSCPGLAAAVGAGALAISAPAEGDDEVAEQELDRSKLPAAVADTLDRELKGQTLEEIEKISYEGIPVLYEAEYYTDGEEQELYVYPNGEVAGRYHHEEGGPE